MVACMIGTRSLALHPAYVYENVHPSSFPCFIGPLPYSPTIILRMKSWRLQQIEGSIGSKDSVGGRKRKRFGLGIRV